MGIFWLFIPIIIFLALLIYSAAANMVSRRQLRIKLNELDHFRVETTEQHIRNDSQQISSSRTLFLYSLYFSLGTSVLLFLCIAGLQAISDQPHEANEAALATAFCIGLLLALLVVSARPYIKIILQEIDADTYDDESYAPTDLWNAYCKSVNSIQLIVLIFFGLCFLVIFVSVFPNSFPTSFSAYLAELKNYAPVAFVSMLSIFASRFPVWRLRERRQIELEHWYKKTTRPYFEIDKSGILLGDWSEVRFDWDDLEAVFVLGDKKSAPLGALLLVKNMSRSKLNPLSQVDAYWLKNIVPSDAPIPVFILLEHTNALNGLDLLLEKFASVSSDIDVRPLRFHVARRKFRPLRKHPVFRNYAVNHSGAGGGVI